MTKRRALTRMLIACAAVLAAGAVGSVLLLFGPANELGLTRFDLTMGGHPDVEALREKTEAVADAWLARHETELAEVCGGPCKPAVDYVRSSRIRSLGYRSSFWYYCWDIYLPYSPQTRPGGGLTVLVQLSDRTAGHNHDPDRFHVLRVLVIDDKGRVTKRFEEE